MTLKRIGLLGMSYETLLRSPVPRTEMEIVRGPDLLERELWMVRGAVERLRAEPGIELVPLLWATALPGGALALACFEAILDELEGLLEASLPLDGIVALNHGAMEVAELDEQADATMLQRVRGLVGPAVPISAALDLHGNMTPGLLGALDVLTALRTAPHRDDRETGWRAAELLLRVIATGTRPLRAAVRLPILAPGELAVTTASPARELYGLVPGLAARPGILDASLMVGFAWNDRPWSGMTTLAFGDDQAAVNRAATELAEAVWQRRLEFGLAMESADLGTGLARAAASTVHPVHLSDSGDNTTAGAPGDLTLVLQVVLEQGIRDAVVTGITAPATVRACHAAGIGATIDIELGAEHVSAPRTARRVEARIDALGERIAPRPGDPYFKGSAAWARVAIGDVTATFHEQAVGIITPAQLEILGIDPDGHRIQVLKLGYLHPRLDTHVRRHILLRTPGAASLDLNALSWRAVPRPCLPLDPDPPWSAEANLYGTS